MRSGSATPSIRSSEGGHPVARRRRVQNTPAVARAVVTVALAVGLAVIVAAAGSVAPGRVRAGAAPSYVGVWKTETSSVQTTTPTAVYFEFTASGKSCAAYDTDPVYQCSAYDPYTAKADTITVQQTGVSGNPWRYRWAVLLGGKLSLNSEVRVGGSFWTPIAKYTLVRATVTKPTPTPAAVKNDRIPPKVVSLTTSIQRDATGAIKTTIRCRATDNVGLKDVTIGYREPGVKPGGLTWYRLASTKDTNPRDQTWTDTFPTDKTGTYTAVCSAADKAKWSSGTTEKPFVVNPGQVKGVATADVAKARAYLAVLSAVWDVYGVGGPLPWDLTRINVAAGVAKDPSLSARWAVVRRSTDVTHGRYSSSELTSFFSWLIQKTRDFLK